MSRKFSDRGLAGNLAGFYYYFKADYPIDHWKPYFDKYKKLGGRLTVVQLSNKIRDEKYLK